MSKKFSHERFNELLGEVSADIRKLSDLKGGEYAGDTDRLANFRRNGEAMGVPMEIIWGVYAAKHWDAIMQYVMDKNTGKTRERMEPIKGRASDLIVYLCLFMAMCEEADTPDNSQGSLELSDGGEWHDMSNVPSRAAPIIVEYCDNEQRRYQIEGRASELESRNAIRWRYA